MTLQEQRRHLWADVYVAQFGSSFNVEAACKAADSAVHEFDHRFHEGGPASGIEDTVQGGVNADFAGSWRDGPPVAVPEPEMEEGGEA